MQKPLPFKGEDMAHPNAETLVRFANGAARKPETREVVRHLLTGCPDCSVIIGTLVHIPVDRDIYGPIFLRASKKAQPESAAE